MPTPKKKTSRSKTGMRRSHDFITRPTTISCNNCGALMMPHNTCPSCGYYRGKEVVAPRA